MGAIEPESLTSFSQASTDNLVQNKNDRLPSYSAYLKFVITPDLLLDPS